MVFNPTSPIQALSQKFLIVKRNPTAHSEVASSGRRSDMPTANSSRTLSSSLIPNWRGGMTHPKHRSQDQHNPPQEISRWSKTTTESEASNALSAPEVPNKQFDALKNKLRQRKRSKDTTNSSPVDPSYNPRVKSLMDFTPLTSDPVTSPTIGPITGPDEPQSFYDSGSDESSDVEPIVQRASSVRVGRPQIVNHSNISGGSIPKLFAPQTTPTGDGSLIPKPLNLSHPSKAIQEPDTRTEAKEKEATGGEHQATLKALEGHEPGLRSPPTAVALSEAGAQPSDNVKLPALNYSDTAARATVTDALPTPKGGFGSLHLPKADSETDYSSSTYVSLPSTIDGLRSNPTTDSDRKLSRAISAPVRHPARRVTIRPTDLIINRASNDHKLFRESIVSTPYPARHNSIGELEEQSAPKAVTPSRHLRRSRPLSNHQEADSEDEKSSRGVDLDSYDEKRSAVQPPAVPLLTKPGIAGLNTSKSDRFPSPVAPEVLFLDLRIARHPSARITVEVEIADKTTFDDEQLFNLVRKAYSVQLLGLVRGVLSARYLSHASITNSSTSHDEINELRNSSTYWHGQHPTTGSFNGADFVKHLLQPRHGHRRKLWLLWLRNQQYHGHASRPPPSRPLQQPNSHDESESPVAFSFMHSRNNSNGANEPSPVTANNAPVTAGGLSRNVSTMTRRPSITIPRMPFQPLQLRPKNSKSVTRAASSVHSRSSSQNYVSSSPPVLYLHHSFSLRRILTVMLLVFVFAIFTTTLWVVFGLPGRGVDDGDGLQVGEYGGEVYGRWRQDAQKRVGVGLLLGFVSLILGFVAEGAWVWSSWVLM